MTSISRTAPARPATPPASSATRIVPSIVWYLAAVIATALVCVLRIVREPRFFFWDDTQLGAFGQWYGLGSDILAGRVTLLSPGAWQGSNYLAEGQWGLWNPATWLIALGTHAVGNATVYATIVKVLFLLVLTTAAYLLAREYGAHAWWAAVAGFTAAMGGQTIFMDAPSWVTGLQNVALFALCWWALKRHVSRGRSPLPFFIFAYLLITFGYVFGVIELAVLLLAVLATTYFERGWRAAGRVLLVGVYSGLLTVFVYLPGLLTSPVTTRSGSHILNDQFLNMDIGDLAASSISTGVSSVRGYWGDLVPVPLQYVTWLIPLFVLFLPVTRRVLRDVAVPLTVLVVTLAFVIGPSVIGPIRYPARMMPYAVLCVAVLFAVFASRAVAPERSNRARVVIAMALTALSGWLCWAAQPSSWVWVLLAVLVQCAVIFVVFGSWRGHGNWGGTPQRAAAWLLAGSIVVLGPQVLHYPSSPLGNFNVPSSISAMHDVGADMDEGILTVGNVYSLQSDPDSYRESLLANLWYLTGKDAGSVYTVLPFTAFSRDLCMDLRGATCPDALDTLFQDTRHPLVDDMALNTVVVIKGEGLETRPTPPSGWTVEDGDYTWTLHRTAPVAPAGDVVRTSDGVTVSTLHRDDLSITLKIDEAPADGGEVVFSRLAWPGYTTTGAQLGDPERGYLLTLDVSANDAGTTLTVSFLPPGWGIEVGAAALAAWIAVGATLWWARTRRTLSAREHVRGELGAVDRT